MLPKWVHVSLVCGIAVASSTITHAATLRVPADFATIQLAIDNAQDGDIVLVAPDTYETELSIPVSITLRSESGPASTVLTGMDVHRVIDSVTADLVLEGFTVERGGDGQTVASNSFFGGGIRVEDSTASLTIDNCVIRLNKAGFGAGVYSKGALTVTNTTVADNGNGQEYPTASRGGGVWCDNSATLDACIFRANLSAFGGGFSSSAPSRCAIAFSIPTTATASVAASA